MTRGGLAGAAIVAIVVFLAIVAWTAVKPEHTPSTPLPQHYQHPPEVTTWD